MWESQSRLIESDAPFKVQLEAGDERASTGFHHDEPAFLHGFQLIRRHQRALDHLQGLTGVIFAPAHGSAHHRARTQRLADDRSRCPARTLPRQ